MNYDNFTLEELRLFLKVREVWKIQLGFGRGREADKFRIRNAILMHIDVEYPDYIRDANISRKDTWKVVNHDGLIDDLLYLDWIKDSGYRNSNGSTYYMRSDIDPENDPELFSRLL